MYMVCQGRLRGGKGDGGRECPIHNFVSQIFDRLCKSGLIADPNSTYLETCNLTCEYGNNLKLGPNIQLLYCIMKVIT